MVEGTAAAPVKVTVTVNRPPQEVFRAFTQETEKWWPLGTHSIAATAFEGKVSTAALIVEGRVGGRIYERMSDGREGFWGEIRVWEPPHRLLFSWKPNLRPEPPTEVEVRFVPVGAGTRVELEHRGWEQLGKAAAERRQSYDRGWRDVLHAFEGSLSSRKG